MKKLAICECCGAQLTAPQLFEGKVYGWTCIKKVNPKPPKKALWVPVDTWKHVIKEASTHSEYYFTVCGIRGALSVYSGKCGSAFEQNGTLFVHEKALNKYAVAYWKEREKA